jgi:hypothetical protein
MKKNYVMIVMAILSMTMVSCTTSSKLISTSTHAKSNATMPVAAVLADLEVSPKKISYFYIPSATVVNGGVDNVVNSAVREALIENDNADVLVALEKQIKYDAEGRVESITVTGYPAKYVNFRNPSDEFLLELNKMSAGEEKGGLAGKLPMLGK